MEGPHLLLRHDKAGDAIKSLPALRALRESFPNADIRLLVSTHNASLFEFEKGIQTHTLPAHWNLLASDTLRDCLAHQGLPPAFSKVVSLLCDASDENDQLLKFFPSTEKYAASVYHPGLREIVNPLPLPRNSPARRDESLNISLLLASAFGLEKLTLENAPRAPVLSTEDAREAETLMGGKNGIWLGFCPFAGLKHRTHPLKKWAAFLPQATRVPWLEKLFLFGSPADSPQMEQLRQRCYRPEKVQLCFPSSFRTLGAYLLRLDGVVAVDSGPLHLARSLGVRSLGILSGGDSLRWFASPNPGDSLLKRGLLDRFPSVLEMTWAYRRWLPTPQT